MSETNCVFVAGLFQFTFGLKNRIFNTFPAIKDLILKSKPFPNPIARVITYRNMMEHKHWVKRIDVITFTLESHCDGDACKEKHKCRL